MQDTGDEPQPRLNPVETARRAVSTTSQGARFEMGVITRAQGLDNLSH
jgi:hypothetical protein